MVKKTISPLSQRKISSQPYSETHSQAPALPQSAATSKQAIRPALKPTESLPEAKKVRGYAVPEDRGANKRVRRGQVETQARIDLHGMRHDEAKEYLFQRLFANYQQNLRCILVITGRGERDQGVLRTGLRRWLEEPSFRALVSGLAPAHARHGGKGAWYVFLRQNTIK